MSDKNSIHPLDPLTVHEVRRVSQDLMCHLRVDHANIRFKLIDLFEPPKDEALAFLQRKGQIPDRRARVYYQLRDSAILSKAKVNITTGAVEQTVELPDSQGPVDWVEYDLVNRACNDHPEILAEVAKLKLPKQ